MNTGTDESLAFGRRFVPFGFSTYPVLVPRRAWAWNGYLHAFLAHRGCFVPSARALRSPLVWLPGPATEPMVNLVLTARDEFVAMPEHDSAAVDEFATVDFAEAS
jgi:hypothetical protein